MGNKMNMELPSLGLGHSKSDERAKNSEDRSGPLDGGGGQPGAAGHPGVAGQPVQTGHPGWEQWPQQGPSGGQMQTPQRFVPGMQPPSLQQPSLPPLMKPAEAQAELQRKSQQMLDMYQKIAAYQAQLQQLKATVPVVPPTSVAARQSAAQVEQARRLAATAQPQMEEMRAELDKALKVARTVNSWFEQNAECLHLQDTTNTPAAFLQRNLESCQSRLNVLSANASVAGEVVRVQNAGSQAPFGMTPSAAIPAPSDQSAYPGPGQPQPAQSVYSPPARPGGQQGQSVYSGSLPPQSDQSVIVGGQQGKSVYSGSVPARLDQSGYGGSQPGQSLYSGSLPPQSDQSAYAGSQPGQSVYSGSLPPQSDQSAYPGSQP
eukprot:CAMPEP_0194482178 /NCGR_PEP_ID=MMETSP0253-20130528/4250_1 /TAXON_ID=2966 /ORGANISM="Noctiluca scintillans" /LENGTH=374 /DNA_ID=CAMNT_0039321701 /DNA_START=71 /DNA_END=1192 /DNA_ORIENTATION=+